MSEARTPWSRPLWASLGLLVAYYAFPSGWSDSAAVIALSLALTVAGLLLVGWTMIKELAHLRRGMASIGAPTLATLLVLLVMSYSLAFYLINLAHPEQFADLHSRTDALYFTLSTMATVGYGDVHAKGQLARGLVCGLIVFNVSVVAALLRAHTIRRSSEI